MFYFLKSRSRTNLLIIIFSTEFAISAPSDSNRKDQLLSSLFPPGHPARTFTWGNLKSLREDLNNDDEKLHLAAHEFRKRHYSAHRMTLAVQVGKAVARNYLIKNMNVEIEVELRDS